MKKLAILGASGHGKVIADTARLIGWDQIIFYDDAWPKQASNAYWPVVGNTVDLLSSLDSFDGVIVGIGDCKIRWRLYQQLHMANAPLVTIVHPNASVSQNAKIGAGSVVFGGAVINIDATVGEACIVNTGAMVDHDCIISHATHIAPGVHLSGNVMISSFSWIGIGAILKQGIRIGSGVLVGAGAVVVKDVADGLTIIGNPASPLAE